MDEDGEFACELVLQDETLPLQIRATIHEGLSWLAIRHIQQGLGMYREKAVARHLHHLASIARSSHSFSLRAGYWALDGSVGNPEQAVTHLYDAVYGKPSEDNTTQDEERYQARREYARALGYNGRYAESCDELIKVLETNPMDFGAGFLLLDATSNALSIQSSEGNSASSPPADAQSHSHTTLPDMQKVIKAIKAQEKVFEKISALAMNNYTGFVPAKGWSPNVLTKVPSAKKFEAYMTKREPFIVRLGASMDKTMGWSTSNWKDENYLIRKAGEEDVQIECRLANVSKGGGDRAFGHGSDSYRKVISFERFVMGAYSDTPVESLDPRQQRKAQGHMDAMEDLTSYMNTQRAVEDPYRTPLHKLKDDIKQQPKFLSDVWDSITEITMWLGNAVDGPTSSRMHFDATDVSASHSTPLSCSLPPTIPPLPPTT